MPLVSAMEEEMKIELKHGAGGAATSELISNLFAKYFSNSILNKMEDGAVLPVLQGNVVFTSDSFVVEPLFFSGGDIGRLSVCGTVNDLAAMGAKPLYLTSSFILETGLDSTVLERIIQSMANTAQEAGIQIVAGDTKVVPGKGGLFINTAGIGERNKEINISAHNLQIGDKIILTGTMGDHHAVIMTSRLGIETKAISDCAPLGKIVERLLTEKIQIHTLRDITRGGLATVANELADASNVRINLQEEQIPVSESVKGLAGILGLDIFTMGNEGKFFVAVAPRDAERALAIIRKEKYGGNAAVVGEVMEGKGVYVQNSLGSSRKLNSLQGEGLPRIC